LSSIFKNIFLNTKVSSLEEIGNKIICNYESLESSGTAEFDYVLIAVGRKPNTDNLGLENTSVQVDKPGFIKIDEFCRTADSKIFAIGDVAGQPMLAHKATRQGHVAAEVAAGLPSAFDNLAIPAIVYTEPEIAWCGLTENEAKAKGINYSVAKFPWSASGRALTLGEPSGTTKIIYDPETMLVKGLGLAGARAGDLISEGVLAIESGLVVEDLAHIIHPHPSLAETIGDAAMVAVNIKARQQQQTNNAVAH
jgi:dihydrolipoamide dehydrogenase